MPKAKPTTQHYIVMEMADEYNDEITRILDSGTPVQVFTSKEDADAECQKRQIKALRGLEVGQYAYDLDEIAPNMDMSDVIEALPFCNFPDEDFNEWSIPDKLTDEQMEKVCKVFEGLTFFTVVEV